MPFLDPEELKPKLREVFETVVIPQIKKAKMKQTAVEWLVENAEDFFGGLIAPSIIEQAKAMQDEQMQLTWNNAIDAVQKDKWHSYDEFYNNNFKSE